MPARSRRHCSGWAGRWPSSASLAVVVFAVLWALGDLDAEQALSLIFGAAFAAVLSGATAYGSGVNVGLGAERLELAVLPMTAKDPAVER